MKLQLASVDYVENLIKHKMELLANTPSTGVDLLTVKIFQLIVLFFFKRYGTFCVIISIRV